MGKQQFYLIYNWKQRVGIGLGYQEIDLSEKKNKLLFSDHNKNEQEGDNKIYKLFNS